MCDLIAQSRNRIVRSSPGICWLCLPYRIRKYANVNPNVVACVKKRFARFIAYDRNVTNTHRMLDVRDRSDAPDKLTLNLIRKSIDVKKKLQGDRGERRYFDFAVLRSSFVSKKKKRTDQKRKLRTHLTHRSTKLRFISFRSPLLVFSNFFSKVEFSRTRSICTRLDVVVNVYFELASRNFEKAVRVIIKAVARCLAQFSIVREKERNARITTCEMDGPDNRYLTTRSESW